MSIEKLPSGNYRIIFYIKRKKHTIHVTYRPTRLEEAKLIREYMESIDALPVNKEDRTFQYYADEYIASKEKVLSASTIRGYKIALKGLPGNFKNLLFYQIEQHDITKMINDMVAEAKPKTIRNRHGFVSAVIKEFRPTFIITTKLPRKEQKDLYTPSEKEVKAVFKFIDADEALRRYYIPLYLGALGLRRSEIGALTITDLSEDNILTICKAKVQDKNNKWIIQPYTKTEQSNRQIPIPQELADRIREQGSIYEGSLNQIYCTLKSVQKTLKLPVFGIHRLRSYFASKAHALGIADSVILKMGGWKTDNVMKSVYRKALQEDMESGSKAYLDHLKMNL